MRRLLPHPHRTDASERVTKGLYPSIMVLVVQQRRDSRPPSHHPDDPGAYGLRGLIEVNVSQMKLQSKMAKMILVTHWRWMSMSMPNLKLNSTRELHPSPSNDHQGSMVYVYQGSLSPGSTLGCRPHRPKVPVLLRQFPSRCCLARTRGKQRHIHCCYCYSGEGLSEVRGFGLQGPS